MKKVYVEIRIENTAEFEVPDGLDEVEACDYIMDNYPGDIALVVNGGDFILNVVAMDDPE